MHRIRLAAILLVAAATLLPACGTEDVPPGNKGFMFDRTGALALYSGGAGLLTEEVLESGTHFIGIYDEVRDVNCKDSSAKESIAVLTKSDLTVQVDIRITYAADCSSGATIKDILEHVDHIDGTVEPQGLYDRYILPVVRSSMRNRLADVTIEDVKSVRTELRDGILADLEKSLEEHSQPVLVKLLQVSNIVLPIEITEKNKQIELARQDAEQEREKQAAATVRLERELFEAQQERKVQVEQANKDGDVARIDAQRDKDVVIFVAEGALEARKREAEGVAALRAELTPQYIRYLEIVKNAEVQNNMATALSNGSVFYIDKDFLVPPGSSATVAVTQ